jgi:glycosyltransferase involved in cell wall biosynthesis
MENHDMPLISIIIPVYNVEEYIRLCLDSVLTQTFSDYECILVDDGSPDNCPTICDEYAEKDFRFSVIHKKNGGLSDARNEGIKIAKGEYIVLLDSDDFFTDSKALANLQRIIETTKPVVIYNSHFTIFKDDDVTSSDSFDKDFIYGDTIHFYKELVRSKITLCGCRFTLNRDFLLRQHLFFKIGILNEDAHWIPRVICATSGVAVNHNLFYTFRTGRPGSITTVISPKLLFDSISTIEEITSWLKVKNIETFHRQVYIDRGCALLRYVFYVSTLLSTEHYQDILLLLKKIKENAPLLLCKISVKNCIGYLLINCINQNYKRFIFCKKIIDIRRKIVNHRVQK